MLTPWGTSQALGPMLSCIRDARLPGCQKYRLLSAGRRASYTTISHPADDCTRAGQSDSGPRERLCRSEAVQLPAACSNTGE
eukprot:358772-Chlamydomonas_euryale.AAC.24